MQRGTKNSLSEGGGRGGVIPGWVNIEQQPDGDETKKHQDERKLRGERKMKNLADICMHVPKHTLAVLNQTDLSLLNDAVMYTYV